MKLRKIPPPFPTSKAGSFVSSERKDNPIQITYLVNDEEKDCLYGEVHFLTTSEGPPGHAHGGCQAAVLDEMMGSCCWANSHPVVAAKIEVEFKNMLPINSKYKTFSKIAKIEGRKVYVEAKIYDENKIYSISSGIFIMLDQAKIEELKKLR